MGIFIRAVVIDLERLALLCGSKDRSVAERIIAEHSGDLALLDERVRESYDVSYGDDEQDEERPALVATADAVRDLVDMTLSGKKYALAYDAALELLCRALADEELADNALAPAGSLALYDQVLEGLHSAILLRDLVFNGTPPGSSLSRIESTVNQDATLDGLSASCVSAPDVRRAAEALAGIEVRLPANHAACREPLVALRGWLERAAAKGRGLVFFHAS